jgi:hypothetical protein
VDCVNVYEIVTIAVTAGTVVFGVIDYLRTGSALVGLGESGSFWFDHLADRPFEQRPSEDEVDAPIPRRPLRGRLS